MKLLCRRRLSSLTAAVTASVCLFPSTFHTSALARIGQGQEPGSARPAKNGGSSRGEDREPTRPRRVDAEDAYYHDGPMIRVGLMLDVASVAISSGSGLVAQRAGGAERELGRIASGQMRAEIRRQPGASAPAKSLYSVEAASSPDPRQARKVTDNLKRLSYDNVSMSYDPEAKEYRVLVGKFSLRSRATDTLERLRRAGYSSARLSPGGEAGARFSKTVPATADRPGYKPASPPGNLVISEAGRPLASSKDTLIIAPAGKQGRASPRGPASTIRVGAKDYRGEIHLVINESGRMNVINAVPLEQYLRGVVPLELSPGVYPEMEALKAQAVAARSYALATRFRFHNQGFDLYGDARSQVYGGVSAEHSVTDRAIEETRGIVATYSGGDARAEPIEALYTANCGGHTEDNEAVFMTRPVPYLRAAECAPDKPVIASREISSLLRVEPLVSAEGRLLNREVALLDLSGFSIPRRVTSSYLKGVASPDELRGWAEQVARLLGRKSPAARGDITRLPAFASFINAAIYGDERSSLILPPADADYLLAGLGGDDLPRKVRADIALLLKNSYMRLPLDGRLSAQTNVTRGLAIETIARSLYLKSQISNLRSRLSNLKSALAQPAEEGRLVLAPARGRSAEAPLILDIEQSARLFRKIAGDSYAVDRLALLGGERVLYHLNADGRVDFLEVEPSEKGAANDRYSVAAQWQERVTAEEMKWRLARARIEVGELLEITPIQRSVSNRVTEVELAGSLKRAKLRGQQVRIALGLKESLFVVEAERDERGRATAFVFTGRGWGHGVGMCQTGAYGLAKEGYSYKSILQKYYKGIRVQRVY